MCENCDRFKERRDWLVYEGIDFELKQLSSEIFAIGALLVDCKNSVIDEYVLQGVSALLTSLSGKVEDMSVGRFPDDAIWYEKDKLAA